MRKKRSWTPWVYGVLVVTCLAVMAFLVADGRSGSASRYTERDPQVLETCREQSGPGRVDLNNASLETLTTLPGIGEVLAQRIIDYRETVSPFVAREQIMDVDGIGQGKYEKLKDRIMVGK